MKTPPRHYLGKRTFLTYPHSNAFLAGGREMIYGKFNPEGPSFFRLDLETLASTPLPPLHRTNVGRRGSSYDVAIHAPILVNVSDNRAFVIDLFPSGTWREVYAAPPGADLQALPSIAPNGSRLLLGENRSGSYAAVEVDLVNGGSRDLFTHPWHANHFHYCLHDDTWVGFSHEGSAETVSDRCWVWHPVHASQGRVAFDQYRNQPERALYIGHERWGFHDRSAYVAAYAVSPGEPRGLYEIFADDRPARLLWASNVVWHCTMDRTGRYAVIDTTGPWDRKPRPGHELEAELHLKADRENLARQSDVVLLDLQSRQDTLLATVLRTRHPYHPHPAISPDARWVAYNDASDGGGLWLQPISLE